MKTFFFCSLLRAGSLRPDSHFVEEENVRKAIDKFASSHNMQILAFEGDAVWMELCDKTIVKYHVEEQ